MLLTSIVLFFSCVVGLTLNSALKNISIKSPEVYKRCRLAKRQVRFMASIAFLLAASAWEYSPAGEYVWQSAVFYILLFAFLYSWGFSAKLPAYKQ